MNKINLTILLMTFLSLTTTSWGQLFSEDFEGGVVPPTGWASFDNGVGTNDWVITATANGGTNAAYVEYEATATGTIDNYLVTPQITPNASNDQLYFYHRKTYSTPYATTYEVRVSTTSQTSIPSFTTIATYTETDLTTSYVQATVDLSAYIGTPIYIAFVHVQNDGDDWYIDDVMVGLPATPEVAITAVNPSQYTVIPVDQAGALPVDVTVGNTGGATAATVNITTNIYALPNITTPVQTLTGNSNALAGSSSNTVALGTSNALSVGNYAFEYIIDGNTGATTDDTLVYQVAITNSLYARDNGQNTTAVGVPGTGNTAVAGNNYDINVSAKMDSAWAAFTGLSAGDTTQFLIYNTATGVPNAQIGQSAEYIITPADTVGGAVILQLPIMDMASNPLVLAPGTYFVGVAEYSSTDNYGLVCGTSLFTPNTGFASVNGGAFSPIEAATGSNLTIFVRAILGNVPCTFAATTSSTTSSCAANTGTATVTPTTGTPTYTYMWDAAAGNQTTGTATGLSANTYNVTVVDMAGCELDTMVTVSNPNAVSVTVGSVSNANCNGGTDGTATANGTGGTGAITYMWSPSAQTAAMATGLAANTYSVVATDANSCTATASVTITEPSAVTATISASSDVNCNGGTDGTATAMGAGGTGAFTYMWSAGGQTMAMATGLAAGPYTVTAADANSCETTASVTITEPSAVTATVMDNGDGTATAMGTGGTGAITYMWDAAAANQTTATAAALMSGNTYCVTATDANSCQDTACVMVLITGVDDLTTNGAFKVYPNPTTGNVFVELGLSNPAQVQVDVYNTTGQNVMTKQLKGQAARIELSTGELPTGVYMIRFAVEEQVTTQKLIIQRP